ncbi:MAG TPA: hypothetical protein VL793_09770, partial [Patescibacteria group bacterium]|nr:hypothetical protein [Patescibacteria group bacterium]
RQTAQFAAALAALGNTQLPNLASISPRRFEIGRLGPVNLSTNISPLHPVPPNQIQVWSYDKRAALTSFGLVLAIATLATLLGRPWRHLTVERKQYQAEGLWLKEEDIGGCEGFARILAAVSTGGQSADPLAEWIREEFGRERSGSSSSNFPSKPLDPHSGKLPPRSSGEILMQDFLDFVNRRLRQDRWIPSHILEATKLITPKRKDVYRRMQTESNERQPYFDRTNLKVLSEKRFIVDEVLNKLLGSKGYHLSSTNEDEAFKVEDAASCARRAGREKYQLRLRRQATLLTLLGIFAPLGLVLAYCCWHDTKPFSLGEPFSLTSGASVWPTEWLRLVGVFLALVFAAESFFRVRHGVLDITRNYRLSLSNDLGSTGYVLETTPVPQAFISANRAWERYQKMGRWWNRCRRLLLPLLVYLVFGFMLMSLGPWPVAPLRGRLSFLWDKSLLWGAILVFLFLTFWTIDATRLCRWFIQYLSEAPTRYPQATLSHFKGLKGLAVGEDILVEWLDLRLIAELTDYVGKLIYFPFVIFFILLLSRHHWWDNWPWTWPLAAIFIVNLLLVVTSAVILQQAAQRARELGLTNLETKLDRMKGEGAQTEEEKARHSVSQAQDLLEDIRQLRKGAFTSFWENPILGALLLPSGGTALIELCSYFLQR